MAKKVINRTLSLEAGTVSFEVIESGDKIICDARDVFGDSWDKLSDVAKHLALHAINAKVGDSAAAPDSDRVNAMDSTWSNLKSGVWATRGEGGTGRVTQLEEALMRSTGKDLEVVRAFFAGLSEEDQKTLNSHPKIVEAKADIKVEKAAAARKAAKAAAKDSPEIQLPA